MELPTLSAHNFYRGRAFDLKFAQKQDRALGLFIPISLLHQTLPVGDNSVQIVK